MKTKLLSFFLITSFFAFSQAPIVNYNSAPSSLYSVVTGVTNESPTGAGVTWNFAALMQTGSTTDTYAAPTAAELITYPGTTNVQTITDAAMVESKIFSSDIAGTLSVTGASGVDFTINYDMDNGTVGTFPLSFGYTNTDAIEGTINASGLTGTFIGTLYAEVDAYGTLNSSVVGQTPYSGSVTRLRVVQTMNVLLLSAFSGLVTITANNYYDDATGNLVFRTTETIANVPPFVNNQTTETKESLFTSTLNVNDNELELSDLKIVPNPISDYLTIQQSSNIVVEEITITDISGRAVLRSKNNSSLNVSNLQSGLYIASITTDKGIVSKRFIKK